MRKYPDLYYIVKGKHNFYEGFKNRIGNLVNFVRCGHNNPVLTEYLRKTKNKEPLTFIQIPTFIDYEGTNKQYLNDIKTKGLYYNSDNTCTFEGEIPILSFVYESGKINSYINGIEFVPDLWNSLSAKVTFTNKHCRLSFNPPLILETPEDVGMSDLEKHQLEQIWQDPKEGMIVFKVQGIDEELDLSNYPELVPQIYHKVNKLLS